MSNHCLRIVMVSTFYPPYHLGGDALHVYFLANELALQGHTVHVIHSIDSYYLNRKDIPSGFFPNSKGVFLHPVITSLGKLSPLLCGFAGTFWPIVKHVQNILKDIKADIIHYHNISGFGPHVLQFSHSFNSIYTAHDYWLICQRNTLSNRCQSFINNKKSNFSCFFCSISQHRPPQLWRFFLRLPISNIKIIISPSDYMKKTLTECGVDRPIKTIYNFVPNPPDFFKKLFNQPYFLFVGTLSNHKGIDNLVKAFIYDDVLSKYHLLIIGTGPLEHYLKTMITQYGLHNILLLGKISDRDTLYSYYKFALALVVPSLCAENNPLVALEAATVGTPLILSPFGGLPEFNKFYNNCYLLPGSSIKDISFGINNWLNLQNPSFRTSCLNASPDLYTKTYLSIISRLINKNFRG